MVVEQKNRKRKAVASAPLPVSKKPKQQIPPEPKTGSRPTIHMFASYWKKKNIPVSLLLDAGCDTSMMSKLWADLHGITTVARMEIKIVENFNGVWVEEADLQSTFPITLWYESHHTKETFEIGPMEDSSDIMLPY
jgi:hypothetical protein